MNTKVKNSFKVLWVYQMVSVGSGAKIEGGQQPSLCFKGRKHMFCVAAGHPVRVIKRDVRDFDKLREVVYHDGPYPLARAIEQFKGIAKRCGITAGADAVLKRAEANSDVSELEDSLTNEEESAMIETPPEAVPGSETDDKETSITKETTVKKLIKKNAKTKAPKAAKAKAKAKNGKAKAAKAPKVPKGPSRISRAVEYMKEEVKKAGGQSKLERGWRKELFARAAKKFDLNPTTCGIQYNKQVLK